MSGPADTGRRDEPLVETRRAQQHAGQYRPNFNLKKNNFKLTNGMRYVML